MDSISVRATVGRGCLSYPEERLIFYRDQDEEAEVVFPDLKHGDPVALDGEITRATESTNTLGLRYQGHTLFCRPDDGRRIAFFKQRIISQQEDHIFPKVKMIGVVNREDKHGGFKAKKPEILFSDIQRRESISGSLF